MTAKEFLQRGWNIHNRIKTKEEQKAFWQNMAEKTTSNSAAVRMGGTSGHSKIETAIDKIDEIDRKLDADIAEMTTVWREIHAAIAKVNNPTYRELLELRYLGFGTWEQIAEKMDKSLRHVYRLHGEALKNVNMSLYVMF